MPSELRPAQSALPGTNGLDFLYISTASVGYCRCSCSARSIDRPDEFGRYNEHNSPRRTCQSGDPATDITRQDSRAPSLAVLVASPGLLDLVANTVDEMRLAILFYWAGSSPRSAEVWKAEIHPPL
jgi:hypothetical protein